LTPGHPTRRALSDVKRRLLKSALELALYVVAVLLVLRLVPALEQAIHNLQAISWKWVVGAIALEVLSETGFVVSWRNIVDPERVLERGGRGQRMDQRVAWAQLGGGLLVPGGSLSGIGVGGWILHRFGMPTGIIAERQFNLSFLNTAVDGLVLVFFGLGLGVGLFAGRRDLLLTVLPAVLAATGIVVVLLVARLMSTHAERGYAKRPKVAEAIGTLAQAVNNTEELLFHPRNWKTVLGAFAYLGFDLLVLWIAFPAVHAHPSPDLAVVVMAYIIGALGGSLPLPANLGTVAGIAGMLVAYGVHHDAAIAAVLLYQAIGLLVPLVGGAIAYGIIRRRLGLLRAAHGNESS
jgi:uncharacterized membrane protein YbhN (UPF0104 family)